MPDPTLASADLLACFQAVAEPTRFEIVRRLSDGERCVCELQEDLDAAQSRLSFHLRKLREAGVISDRRQGRWVHYRLVPAVIDEMRAFLGEVGGDVSGEARPDDWRPARTSDPDRCR